MTSWLEPTKAAALVESSAAVESEAWVGDVAAARAYVEGKRRDLFTTDDPPVFVAGADVLLGTAMLAARLYARRRSPLGTTGNAEFGAAEMLRHDPDIAKLLGIGVEGTFVIGGPTTPLQQDGGGWWP